MCRLRNIALESVTCDCDRRTTDKVIPMCRYASQAIQKLTHRKLHPFYRGRYKNFDEIRPKNTRPGESNIPPIMLRFSRVTIDKSERFESPASCNTQWIKFHKFYYM